MFGGEVERAAVAWGRRLFGRLFVDGDDGKLAKQMSEDRDIKDMDGKAGSAGGEEGGKVAATAGRGAAALAVAKLYFLVSGLAIYFVLPRILSPEQWGDYLLVTGVAVIINNVMVSGTIQAVSRFTAQNEVAAAQVRWAGLRMHAFLGTGASVLLMGLGVFLSWWWKDLALAPLFLLMGAMVVFYANYSVFVGSANGQRRFLRQAGLDMGYATLKAILVLLGAWLLASHGDKVGVGGALGGLVTASGVILVVSVLVVGAPSRAEPKIPVRPLAKFALALFLYTLIFNLLMRVDLILIKRFGATLAPAGVGSAAFASKLAAQYGTAQVFAFVTLQVLMSVALVLFPLVSRSTAEKDHEKTRLYVGQTMRVGALVGAGVAAVLSSRPGDIVTVIYPETYRAAGLALQYLSWGVAALALMALGCWALNGAGKSKQAILVVLVALVAAAGLDLAALMTADNPAEVLSHTAAATAAGMGVGLVAAAWSLWKNFGVFMPWASLVRVLVAGGVTFAVGLQFGSASRLVVLGRAFGLGILYLVVLAVLREFTKADLELFKGLLSRKKKA